MVRHIIITTQLIFMASTVSSLTQIWLVFFRWPWWFVKADSLDLKHLVVRRVQIQHYATFEFKKLTVYIVSKMLCEQDFLNRLYSWLSVENMIQIQLFPGTAAIHTKFATVLKAFIQSLLVGVHLTNELSPALVVQQVLILWSTSLAGGGLFQ